MANEAEKMSFEEALKELETIVEKLERGDVSLDDAVMAYERGTELKQHCQKRLDEAKMRVEAIRAKKASSVAEDTAPCDQDS
jgi:exodeoxyribonuclease VII small subunit